MCNNNNNNSKVTKSVVVVYVRCWLILSFFHQFLSFVVAAFSLIWYALVHSRCLFINLAFSLSFRVRFINFCLRLWPISRSRDPCAAHLYCCAGPVQACHKHAGGLCPKTPTSPVASVAFVTQHFSCITVTVPCINMVQERIHVPVHIGRRSVHHSSLSVKQRQSRSL